MLTAISVATSVPLAETELYEVTAYTAGPESTGKTRDHPAHGITASGARVREGITAACPPELPFGTRVHIEGVGERVCLDRGGAIKGRRLDVYIADRSEALRFGRRKLEVEIIERGTIE
ncbi:hypothetical protein M655_024945 [Brevibacillus sp. NSP2.1]|nr:hypothetical protein M655_024945 [Brevibacillus sp. NSP2.1]